MVVFKNSPRVWSVHSGHPTVLLCCEERQGWVVQGPALKALNGLREEIVILLEQWLELHRLYQVSTFYDNVAET